MEPLIIEALTRMVEDIIAFLPSVIAALIVILVGYVTGAVVGRAVNMLIEKMGLEKSFEESGTGKAFRSAGFDISSFFGSVTKAFVVILSIILAIQILNIGNRSFSVT